MKLRHLTPLLLILLTGLTSLLAQAIPDSLNQSNADTPADRAALMRKLQQLPCAIGATDSKATVLQKLKTFLDQYKPNPAYPEDIYAKLSVDQALASVLTGGYGIGAILVDANGQVLHGAHNAQLQQGRSDLHAEMTLLNEFETLPQFRKYKAKAGFTGGPSTIYTEQLRLYTSTEPCPMCFIRVSIVGVDTRFVSAGPDDGMAAHADCLPKFWYELSEKHKVVKAKSSPVLQQMAHVLFFSFLL